MSGKRNRIMADKGMTDFVKYSTYTYNIKNALWHTIPLRKFVYIVWDASFDLFLDIPQLIYI